MGTKIIQADKEDLKQVEKEEQNIFVFEILSLSGIPVSELEKCFDSIESGAVTIQQRIYLRKLCTQYGTFISDDMNGGVTIYVNDKAIAEWKKPHIVLKIDSKEKDKTKRLYLEIHCSWWSCFEGKNE